MLIAHYKTIPTLTVSLQTFPQTMTLSRSPTIPFYCSFIVGNFNDSNVSISQHKTGVNVSMLLTLLSYWGPAVLVKLSFIKPSILPEELCKWFEYLWDLDRFYNVTNSKINYIIRVKSMVSKHRFEFRNTWCSLPTFFNSMTKSKFYWNSNGI